MSSVFGRLEYNFDDAKYGSGIYLSDNTKNYLNAIPTTIQTWQISDIANGVYTSTNYFKNPIADSCDGFYVVANTLLSVANSIEFWDNVSSNANGFITNINTLRTEIQSLKKHAGNVSGITNAVSDEYGDYPDYRKAVALGQQLLTLLNKSDAVENSSPILGCMTSLFINTDLVSSNTTINTDVNTLSSSKYVFGEDSNVYSSISLSEFENMNTHVKTAITLTQGRREHDWNFYRNSMQVLKDYLYISTLTKTGNTQNYLISTLIGTDYYKAKLNIA